MAERALVAFFGGRKGSGGILCGKKGLGAQFWGKRALWGTILVVYRALGHNCGGKKGLGAQF